MYANQSNNISYTVAFGYGNPNFKLSAWGSINANNANISEKNIGHGMFRYTISPKDKNKNFGTTASFNQVPIMPSKTPTKNISK